MYHVRLTRIRSNHQNLRSDGVVGIVPCLPSVGEPISLRAKGFDDPSAIRIVHTTPVKRLRKRRLSGGRIAFIIDTENSRYELAVLQELVS